MFSRRELIWGYAAQGLSIGFGFILLPLIVRNLSSSELGLWFVFLTLAGLAQLLETGFQPTLARNIAYVFGGAQDLAANGLQEPEEGALMNTALLANVIAASRFIYRGIAVVTTLLLLVVGTLYITTLIPASSDQRSILVGWSFFALGNILNFYFGYLNAFLQGRGDVIRANQVMVASRSVQLVLAAGLLLAGMGLLGLGIATLVSAVASRLLAYHFVHSDPKAGVPMLATSAERARIVSVLWHQASRFGLVLLGAFLIWRANILVASSTLGLAEAASYGLAIQIFILLNAVASVPFNLSLPKLSRMRAQGDMQNANRLFASALVTTLLLYSALALSALVFGNVILAALDSQVRLPIWPVFGAMVVVFLLELNHGTCANFILTGNQIPFVAGAVVTGIAIVTLSIVLSPWLGIGAFVICQAVCQLCYNNWKWPHEISKMAGKSFPRVLIDGAREMRTSRTSRPNL